MGGEAGSPSDTPSTVEASGATPDELMRTAYAQIDSALRQDLLTRVLAAPPAFFEQLVVTLLVRMGDRAKSDGGHGGLTAQGYRPIAVLGCLDGRSFDVGCSALPIMG